MAKHFKFDDNEEFNTQHFEFDDSQNDEQVKSVEDNSKDDKKKSKLWYLIPILAVVAILGLGVGYLIFAVNDNKPVLGNRCEGIQVISQDILQKTITKMEKNDEIKSMNIEIFCKEVRIDLEFKKGTSLDTAKSLAKKSVKQLDKYYGHDIVSGSSYSDLFGTYENVTQYEVELYMTCSGNKKFPVYGTKHANSDTYSWTLSSVRDKKTYKKVKK